MGVINIITLLLAGWRGWRVNIWLKVRSPRPRAKYFCVYPVLRQSMSILSYDRRLVSFFRSSFSPRLFGLFIVFFIKSTRVTLRIKWQLYLLLKNNLTVWFKTMNAHASIMKSQWVRIQRGKVSAPTTSLCSYFIENFAKFLSRIDKTKPCSSAIKARS